jgi:DNA-directed RNA polymerase specialized sigma24 family protein
MEQLWPWFWSYVGIQLGEQERAGDLADDVAYRVSAYIQTHCQVRSLVGLCRVAAIHLVRSTRSRERRIEFRGLSQEIEASLGPAAADWQEELEFTVWVDQVLQNHAREIRVMLRLRLLDKTWDHVGEALGMSGGQARLRFYRALEEIRANRKRRRPDRGGT